MSKPSEMEEKVQALLNECIGIICDLPVNDPDMVRQATGGKIDIEEDNEGFCHPSAEDQVIAKALVPTLKWLMERTQKQVPRKRKAATKPAQKPGSGNDDSSSSSSPSATTPRKKKNAGKTDGEPEKQGEQAELPV